MTTRDYAQTVELLALHDIPHDVVGPAHGGAGAIGKGAGDGRTRCERSDGYAKSRGFDLALSHASHELPLVARSLGIPSAYAFDYEFARVAARPRLPGRAAGRRSRRDPAGAARPARRAGLEGAPLPGPEGGVLPPRIRARTPPSSTSSASTGRACSSSSALRLMSRSTTVTGTRSSRDVLDRLGSDAAVQAVVLPRTTEQRPTIAARGLPSLVVPEHAVDAQSLVALSDLVVSAGGTMNREAVALGVPVYTTFAGRLGAVDEVLVVDEGRLRVLTSADELELEKRATSATRIERDPACCSISCCPRSRRSSERARSG